MSAFHSVTCTLALSPYRTVVYDDDAGRYVEFTGDENDENTTDQKTYRGRICPCVWDPNLPDFFCIEGTGDLCRVSRIAREKYFQGEDPVTCLDGAPTQEFIRSVWPVIPLTFGALICSLFLTRPGRGAVKYILSFCFSRINSGLIDRVYRREMLWLERARQAVQREARGDSDGSQPPSSYVLRTEIFDTNKMLERKIKKREQAGCMDLGGHGGGDAMYASNNSSECTIDTKGTDNHNVNCIASNTKEEDEISTQQQEGEQDFENEKKPMHSLSKQASSMMSSDDEDFLQHGVTCTICILDIEDGDRIGVLPCEHYFHVDCLKPWILKKNSCPLCQKSNIAQPRFDNENEEEDTEDNENNGAAENNLESQNSSQLEEQQQGGLQTLATRIRSTGNRIRARLTRRNNSNNGQGNEDHILHVDSITTQEAIIHRRLRNPRRDEAQNRFLVLLGID